MKNRRIDALVIKIRYRIRTTPANIYAGLMLLALVIVGTIGFVFFERWTLQEAVYATIVTVTTVGYGDFTPITIGGQIFATIFVVMAVGIAGYAVSTIAAYVIKHEQQRVERKIWERRMKELSQLTDHIIVCGADIVGGRVAREFRDTATPYLVVEPDETKLRYMLLLLHDEFLEKRYQKQLSLEVDDTIDGAFENEALDHLARDVGVQYLLADPTDDTALIRAGIKNARGLITTLEDDRDNLFVVLSARQLANRLENANFYIVSRLVNGANVAKLKIAGADRILSLEMLGGFQMAASMLQPEVTDFWLQMYRGDRQLRFFEIHLALQPTLVNKTVSQVAENHEKAILAVKRGDQYYSMPAPDFQLQQNDILIGVGKNTARQPQNSEPL